MIGAPKQKSFNNDRKTSIARQRYFSLSFPFEKAFNKTIHIPNKKAFKKVVFFYQEDKHCQASHISEILSLRVENKLKKG